MALTCFELALIESTMAIIVAFFFCGCSSSHYNLLSEDLFLNKDTSFLSFEEREIKGKRRLTGVYRIKDFPLQHLPTLPLLGKRWLAIFPSCGQF